MKEYFKKLNLNSLLEHRNITESEICELKKKPSLSLSALENDRLNKLLFNLHDLEAEIRKRNNS